jgi:hypothetical protein
MVLTAPKTHLDGRGCDHRLDNDSPLDLGNRPLSGLLCDVARERPARQKRGAVIKSSYARERLYVQPLRADNGG